MNRDREVAIETRDLPQVPPEILDVIADAAHAKLAEIRKVLPDLRRIQMKLLRQRLGRNRLHAAGIKLVQAAQVDRQAVRGQLGHLVGGLPPLVRSIHKRKWYCKVLELDVGANVTPPCVRPFSPDACDQHGAAPAAPACHIGALRQFSWLLPPARTFCSAAEFKEDGGKIMLDAEDGNMRIVLTTAVRTSSGPVEVRGQMIDVGRWTRGDPRAPDAETRDASRWPRPGEELFVRVTAVSAAQAAAAVSIRTLALEPWNYAGQKITVTGNFRGPQPLRRSARCAWQEPASTS
jgi:hypothetical protein